MSFSFYTRGTPITIRDYEVGVRPDGESWAYIEADDDVLIDTRDRIDVCDDDGRRLWIGVVQRAHHSGGVQRVLVNDLTATVMAHRVTSTGEPDPHFRYGDVIRSRYRSIAVNDNRYMVVKRRPGTTDEYEVIGLTGRGRGQGFDIGEADWELAE